MTAGTHDDGRLFGMGADGTIWTEPALELRDDTVGRPEPCAGCGCDVIRGAGEDCPSCLILDEYGTLDVPADVTMAMGRDGRRALGDLLARVTAGDV